MSDRATTLRGRAGTLAAAFPSLLVRASQLAASVAVGDHGRRRAGQGDAFWQYRPAQPGDPARAIDWRRSARADQAFVQDKEWQISQSLQLWVHNGASMRFGSGGVTKAARAQEVALAAALLALNAGERVGLSPDIPPARGRAVADRIAYGLMAETGTDEAPLDLTALPPRSQALLVSDFLGDLSAIEEQVRQAAHRGVGGCLVMVLDRQEETFPFAGRTIFQSVSGAQAFETRQAKDLKDRYLSRLANRKDRLAALARHTGWRFTLHHTDVAARVPLLWIHETLGGLR